jgi:hypothetical protein
MAADLILTNDGIAFANGSIQPSAAQPQIMPVGASVAGNVLTVSLNACSLGFRNTIADSGSVTYVTSSSTLTLNVPDTATLGTVSAQQSRIVILALNNAGTMELAVVNIAGGNDLTETGLISTTAMSTGADSSNVVYSTTARTSVAYRVVGYVESTQATAGTWATTPSKVQGFGGQALAAMSSLGYGQQVDVTGIVKATTYYNTFGRPFLLSLLGSGAAGPACSLNGTVNGVEIARSGSTYNAASNIGIVFPVPTGASYSFNEIGGVVTIAKAFRLF